MKLRPTAFVILIAATLLVSCSDHAPDSNHDEGDAHSAHSTPPEVGVRLNDGHKWKMDAHTRSSFAQMANSFLTADHSALKEEGLKKMGSDLQGEIKNLIQGCTMTGEAHDQLHTYLGGYVAAVASLSKSGRIEDARKIKHYLEEYGEFFE
ncbi:MAG: hypothetical protein GY725_23025 [bacterium]|nr:hypothetical protein [bacterium]